MDESSEGLLVRFRAGLQGCAKEVMRRGLTFLSLSGFWLLTLFDILIALKRYAGGLVCFRQTSFCISGS